MNANRLNDGRVGRRLSTCVVPFTCVTWACSERSGADPDRSTNSGRVSASALPGLRTDLARIVGDESPERADTLLRMFRERGFDPLVEEFPNTATGGEPRAVGRNLIVTVGGGRRDIVVGAHYDVVRVRGGGVTDGAVDNGAAAVVLTKVAETLRRHDHVASAMARSECGRRLRTASGFRSRSRPGDSYERGHHGTRRSRGHGPGSRRGRRPLARTGQRSPGRPVTLRRLDPERM